MISLVSFSTTIHDIGYPDTELRQIRLEHSAYRHMGINRHNHWTRGRLKATDFYRQHQDVLDLKPGAGYYLWKPYIILDALQQAHEGDWVLYCDNSLFFIKDAAILVELAERNHGFGFFCYAANYTVRHIMQPVTRNKLQVSDAALNKRATWSGLILLQRNPDTIQFVQEWFWLCQDPELLVNQKEPCPPGINHKQDMPLLSYLRVLKGIEGFRIPHQYGDKNKLKAYRREDDFLMDKDYEDEVFENSPYDTLCTWDKNGEGCRRPFYHFIDPHRILSFVRRKAGSL